MIGGKFNLGIIKCSPDVSTSLPEDEIQSFIERHVSGDWGNMDTEDKLQNDSYVKLGAGFIKSAYVTKDGDTIHVITVSNITRTRTTTTILFPHEY